MKKFLTVTLFLACLHGRSQTILQPGFNSKEYVQLLSLAYFNSSIPDSVERLHQKDIYRLQYSSAEVGLLNRWNFFLRNDNVGVIQIRGTVNKLASWLENFYAAVLPATGSLQLNDSTKFEYQLSDNSKAMVHTGWTIGLAYLAPEILKKVNQYYTTKQTKEYFLFGHSQGGAITFLLRSWLEYEKQKGHLPTDIVFKTYCSAAPKPGNLYYAYDFDFITRNGWAFNIVNMADWVPETPFSIQTINEFNKTNPFAEIKTTLKKQKFITRLALKTAYNKMNNSTRKAQKKFEKYLGKQVYKQVKKFLPQLKEPTYANGNNYMRAGTAIVLKPDEEYYQRFPDNNQTVFIHHMFAAYYMLVKKYYP